MKNIVYILLITLMVSLSCSIHRSYPVRELSGEFIWNESFFDVSESIELFSDSTFIFKWKQGLMWGKTQGRFTLKEGDVKLFSEYTHDSHKFNLVVPPQTKQDYYEILVRHTESFKLVGASCIAFKEDKIIDGSSTNEMGICKLPIDNVDSISIEYVGYRDAGFPTTKNRSPKSLIVELVDGEHYHYFIGEILKISNLNKMKLKTLGRNKTFERKNNEI